MPIVRKLALRIVGDFHPSSGRAVCPWGMEHEGSSHVESQATGRKALRAIALSLLLLLGFGVAAFTLVLPEDDLASIPAHLVLPAGADAWQEGSDAYRAGDLEVAAAYWRQVPETSEDWARSQRFLGWKLHVQEGGEPRKALPYVHRSLLADPLDGNVWQDLGRTYAATLGFGQDAPPRVPSAP